jgi:hypothetical protein
MTTGQLLLRVVIVSSCPASIIVFDLMICFKSQYLCRFSFYDILLDQHDVRVTDCIELDLYEEIIIIDGKFAF